MNYWWNGDLVPNKNNYTISNVYPQPETEETHP
jgi:hypothetical protein